MCILAAAKWAIDTMNFDEIKGKPIRIMDANPALDSENQVKYEFSKKIIF